MKSYLVRNAVIGFVAGIVIVLLARVADPRGSLFRPEAANSLPTSTFADAVERALPSVVSIATTKAVGIAANPLLNDPVFRQYLDIPEAGPNGPFGQRTESGLGSGVVIDTQGHVVTNHHVIADTDSIQVVLNTGKAFPARVVGTDPDSDLAVLKIDSRDLNAIEVGNSESLRVGDVVLAIGTPLGFVQTVTQGIVSATGRNRVGVATFENFIQTDAAINPGNSGGALVTSDGKLVGINSAILSENGGFQGIGLAIPSQLVLDVVDQILARGYVVRGWLGVSATPLANGGVIVQSVVRGSPADRAGIQRGDVILAINDVVITDAKRALDLISSLQPKATARVILERQGQRAALDVMVSTRPININQP